MFGIFIFLHLNYIMFINVEKTASLQMILQLSRPNETAVTNSAINALANSEYTVATAQTKCTYNKNITVYMDAFERIVKRYPGAQFQGLTGSSQKCDSLPGGGRCSFNHNNTSSDAILYYGSYTTLKYKRVFDGQIVIVYTLEAENGQFCHFPPPDQYDMKISYRRDSTVPVPFLCVGNLALRLAEMGQPDVPVGREKLAAGFISNCAFKPRNKYIKALMKYIHVDQWGKCFRNTRGEFWKTRQGPFEQAKLNFLNEKPYKFLITFENTEYHDYITEKIYHAYLTRSIPIFYGDKAVFDLVPANTSLIYANNYTPEELAKLIKRIDSNDTLYSEYFKNWDLVKMRKLHEQYCSEYFICATCRKVWETLYHRKCGNQATG